MNTEMRSQPINSSRIPFGRFLISHLEGRLFFAVAHALKISYIRKPKQNQKEINFAMFNASAPHGRG